MGVSRSTCRSRASRSVSCPEGWSKNCFSETPSASHSKDRLSTEIPFSPSSTDRRKLWDSPHWLASRFVVHPFVSRSAAMRFPISIKIPRPVFVITIAKTEGYIYIYSRSKISRNYWLFEPKCRNNAEITYTQRLQIASYFP